MNDFEFRKETLILLGELVGIIKRQQDILDRQQALVEEKQALLEEYRKFFNTVLNKEPKEEVK